MPKRGANRSLGDQDPDGGRREAVRSKGEANGGAVAGSDATDVGSGATSGDGLTTNLKALDGVRTCLSVWMIVWHSYWWLSYFVTDEELDALGTSTGLAVFGNGYLAVDGFFVLSGLLLGLPLFSKARRARLAAAAKDEGDASKNAAAIEESSARAALPELRVYVFRRLVKIWPPLALLLVLHCGVFFRGGMFPMSQLKPKSINSMFDLSPDPRPEMFPNTCEAAPANLLFLNNILPFGGCAGYTWSLAVQCQFYVLLPLLWRATRGGKRFVNVCIAVVVASTLFRVLQGVGLERFQDPIEAYFFWFQWYAHSFPRFGTLFVGVLLAHVLVDRPDLVRSVTESATKRRLGYLVIAVTYACAASWRLAHDSKGLIYIIHTVAFQPGGVCLAGSVAFGLLCVIVRAGSFASWCSEKLAAPVFSAVAPLTFLAYLLHPLLLQKAYATVLAPVSATTGMLIVYTMLCEVATFALAKVLQDWVVGPVDSRIRGWTAASSAKASSKPVSVAVWTVFIVGLVILAVAMMLLCVALHFFLTTDAKPGPVGEE